MAKYTNEELDSAAIADLRADMTGSLRQADDGPYYPECGITADSLRAYAEECRRMIDKYSAGGAHKAVLAGKG